jgi:hypothetical protein
MMKKTTANPTNMFRSKDQEKHKKKKTKKQVIMKDQAPPPTPAGPFRSWASRTLLLLALNLVTRV